MFLLQIMQGRGRRNQPESRPDFPWFSFPNVVAPKVLVQWIEKLAWLKERKVHIPAKINWNWLEEVGLSEAIEPFLTKSFDGVQGQFICMDWRRLFTSKNQCTKNFVWNVWPWYTFARKRASTIGNHYLLLGRGKKRFVLGGLCHEDGAVSFVQGSHRIVH